jgi:hypothetical protein
MPPPIGRTWKLSTRAFPKLEITPTRDRVDDPNLQREALSEALAAVRTDADGLELSVRSTVLVPPPEPESSAEPADEALIREHIPLHIRRRGVETRLVIEGVDEPGAPPDPTLLKALARAHRWWEDLRTERYQSLRELADAYETDGRYVARVLRLAFLPADMARTVLSGKTRSPVLRELLESNA